MSSLEIPRSGITSSILVSIYLPPISFLESLYQRASHHQWLSVIISFCHQFVPICKNKTEHETGRCQCVRLLPVFVLHSTPDSGWPRFKTAAAVSLQLCPTLCDPVDGSPPGSPFPGILQARIVEWSAIAFSNAWKWKVKVKSLSHVRLLATPWTVAYQAPPSMGFSRQEYWSGAPLPSPSKS